MFVLPSYNAIRKVLCEDWHFTHMLKALGWPHQDLDDRIISLGREDWAHKTTAYPASYIDLSVLIQESERSCFVRDKRFRFCLLVCFILFLTVDLSYKTWITDYGCLTQVGTIYQLYRGVPAFGIVGIS